MAVQATWRDLLLHSTGVAGTGAHPIAVTARLVTVDDGVRALLATDRCILDLEANVRPRSALATMVQGWPELASR
jgi:hypothetical protein